MPVHENPLAPATVLGVVGVGHMGYPMASRLLDAGYTVRCYDTDPRARRRVADRGAQPVDTPAQVLTDAAAVLMLLPSSDQVEEVLLTGGIAAAVQPGTVLVDMGSSQPSSSRMLGQRFAASRVGYVDAPVSGGVAGAETGALTIMVSGPDWAVATVRPVLDVLGSKVLHVGEVGAGHALKALNNLLSATHLLATSEAMRIGEAFGLNPETMLAAFNSSSGRSGSTEVKWPKHVLPSRFDSGFGLRLMLKDMRIAVQLASDTGRSAALAQAAVQLWDQASQGLPPDADHTEIVRWLDKRTTDANRMASDRHPV
ncbi:MAG: NAD(P)-dependent oxidoreductase [Carbonactinosporaceae bacterium]